MFGLGGGKNVFVGVDVGTSTIKLVELKVVDGKPVLSNYAWMPFDKSASVRSEDSASFEASVSVYIKKIISEAKIKGKGVHVAIPAFGGFITLIDFPHMAKSEMEQAIRFEAHKYIPTPLEEVVLSWDTVDDENQPVAFSDNQGNASGANNPASAQSKTHVLLVAASKGIVARYENMISNSGLRIESIEIESFSMVRSLIGHDPGNFVVVDIGSRICNIILVERGIIKANRNIDAGGKDITNTITRSMGIDDVRAEKMKTSGKNFFSQDSALAFPTLDTISAEIMRMAGSYYNGRSQFPISSVILSGGTANLSGINEYLSKSLGMKVVTGNPWSRVKYDDKLAPVFGKMGTQFSVAIGLALKGAENYLINNK